MISQVALTGLIVVTPDEVKTDQAKLDQVAIECELLAGDLTIESGNLVRISPKKTPSYESVICALPKLQQAGFSMKIGFISEPPADKKN